MPLLSRIGGAAALARHFGGGGRKVVALALSANQANYLLDTSKVAGYEAGNTDVVLTIDSGVVIGSTSSGTYAFTVDTSWSAGDTVKVINNGTICGAGGAGGAANGGAGSGGGPGVSIQRPTTINNTSGTLSSGGTGGTGGAYAEAASYTGDACSCTTYVGQVGASGGAGGKGAGAGASGTYAAAAGAGGSGSNYSGYDAGGGCGNGVVYGGTGATGGTFGVTGTYLNGSSNVTWDGTGTRVGNLT